MKYIYGPVNSRRLGLSLGVSVIPHKTCSFDCIYCQLGATSCQTTLQKSWVDAEAVIAEVGAWFDSHHEQAKALRYITLAGTGEPTLNTQLGEIIARIQGMTAIPVAVITNASLFRDPEVRRRIVAADLVVPSLDAADQEIFRKIDRPLEGARLEDIIDGLVAFRNEYSRALWLEIMLVAGVNDSPEHVQKLKAAVERIRPDKVQLNSPVRVPKESGVRGLTVERLREICAQIGNNCEVV